MTTDGMIPVGRTEDLRRRPLTKVDIDGTSVVIIAMTDGFKAVVNRCPHQQAELLHEGSFDGNGLTCPLHGRTFDLSDGRCRNGAGRLSFVPCHVSGDVLLAGPVPTPDFPSF